MIVHRGSLRWVPFLRGRAPAERFSGCRIDDPKILGWQKRPHDPERSADSIVRRSSDGRQPQAGPALTLGRPPRAEKGAMPATPAKIPSLKGPSVLERTPGPMGSRQIRATPARQRMHVGPASGSDCLRARARKRNRETPAPRSDAGVYLGCGWMRVRGDLEAHPFCPAPSTQTMTYAKRGNNF